MEAWSSLRYMSDKDSICGNGLPRTLAYCHVLQFVRMFAMGVVLVAAVIVANAGAAYAHGCQAQGGCCTVGSACVEISANSPIFMIFAVVGLGAVTMMAFYGKSIQKSRLGAIFNIFI